MKKQRAALALLCILAVAMSACRSQDSGFVININETPSKATTLSMFVPVEADPGGAESFRDLMLAYNALQSNVQVTVDSASTAKGFDQFLEQRLDADRAVDVFVVNAESVKAIARKKQFYDLSSLDSFKELTGSAREQAVVNGVAYSIPLKMAVYVMDVNVSLLERYGLETPQNYDEFQRCCQVLKEQGVTPIAINRWWAMAVPVMARGLYPIYQAENRGELIEGLNTGELKIGDYMIEGFRMFEQFLDKGYYGDNLVMEEVDAIQANTREREEFYNGKAAFFFCPIEDLNVREMENGDQHMTVGVPMLPDGAITLPSISVRLSVNANSRHLEEAIAFVDFIASKRVELLAEEEWDSLSPFHRTASLKTGKPGQTAILEMLEDGRQVPLEDMELHFGYWDNTRKLCLAMIGGMTAEEAAEEYNRIQIEEMRAYEAADQL